MAVTVKTHQQKPIIIVQYADPLNVKEDLDTVFQHATSAYSEDLPVFVMISDLSAINLEFSDMMIGMQEATVSRDGFSMTAPNVTLLVVTRDEMPRLGAEAFQQDQYGSVMVPVFEDLDAALAHAEKLVSEAS
jgi:hypothetical protein